MTTPYESGEALEIDEQALDRVWEALRCELPGYKATPVQLVDLTGIAERRKAIYASMLPREERLRRAEELFAQAHLFQTTVQRA